MGWAPRSASPWAEVSVWGQVWQWEPERGLPSPSAQVLQLESAWVSATGLRLGQAGPALGLPSPSERGKA